MSCCVLGVTKGEFWVEESNPSLMLSNVPVLGQAWFPSPGEHHHPFPAALVSRCSEEWQDLQIMRKNFHEGNAPGVSLGMLLAALPAPVCVNINPECNVWISAGSRWEISTSPGSHQCSLVPAPKQLPPQKKWNFSVQIHSITVKWILSIFIFSP